jgi:excinuclease UvrABC nuclease subunit
MQSSALSRKVKEFLQRGMRKRRPNWKKRHWVYLLYDNDEVVYIGCTLDLKRRIDQHKDKVFNSVAVKKHWNQVLAMSEERKLIILYNPKYNWIPAHLKARPELGILKKKAA